MKNIDVIAATDLNLQAIKKSKQNNNCKTKIELPTGDIHFQEQTQVVQTSSGGGGVLAQVTSSGGSDSVSYYNVTLYANGKDKPSTGTGKLFLTYLIGNNVLTAGQWIVANIMQTGIVDGDI